MNDILKKAALIQVDEHRIKWAKEPISSVERTVVGQTGGPHIDRIDTGPMRVEQYFVAALNGLLANPNITGQNMDPKGIAALAWAVAQEGINMAPGS